MTGWMSLLLAVIATTTSIAESRAITAEPVSLTIDAYGNPMMVIREKRTALSPFPHRAMMFTGYYRPIRRSSNGGGQATGVYAQGNAVSGEAFFGGGVRPTTVRHNRHSIPREQPLHEEPEISSAEAHAGPEEPEESFGNEEPVHSHHEENGGHGEQEEEHEVHHHHHHQDDHPQEEEEHPHAHHPHHAHPHHHHEEGELPSQDGQDSEANGDNGDVASTEASPVIPEDPITPSTEVGSASRPSKNHGKKPKKNPFPSNDDDDRDDDDDDDEDDQPVVPFVPFKGNKRRNQNYPHLNNFFPMVFSFPGVSSRDSGSGVSPPGAVTAIANSYSTGKGGVASSVATAYGGSPNGKKRRAPPSEE